MQIAGPPWRTPPSPRQNDGSREIGWFVCALVVLGLVALLVMPVVYFISYAGLLEKTIAVATLVGVLTTHAVKTFGR